MEHFISSEYETDLVINKVSKLTYDKLSVAGMLQEDQLYLVDQQNLDAGGFRVINVGEPSLGSDAATKNHVDSRVSGCVQLSSSSQQKISSDLEIAGDMVVGSLTAAGSQVVNEWGRIIGNLTAQSDLKQALDQKASASQIPTKTSQLQNDSGFLTAVNSIPWENVTGRPDGVWMSLSGTYDDDTTFSYSVWTRS